MNGSLAPWRLKEPSAWPGPAFFTHRLLGMGLSTPCSLKAFILHPGASGYDQLFAIRGLSVWGNVAFF